MKLITLNIEGSKHLSERVLPFLKKEQADVLCLQEVFAVDVEKIENTLGIRGRFVPLANVDQKTVHTPKPLGLWGIYLGTRLPAGELGHQFYKGDASYVPKFLENNEPNSLNRALIWLKLTDGRNEYLFATTHFVWSFGGKATTKQRRYLDKLLKLTHQLPPHVLGGDFNAPRGGEIFSRLEEDYLDNIPAEVTTTLDKKFHRAGKLDFVVDGLFSHPEYKLSKVRVVDGLSDHMAIVADVRKKA